MKFLPLPSGYSVEKREVPCFITEGNASRYVYLLAGVHGDEVEGVHVMAKLFEWLKTTDKVKLPLVVIPLVNPDGYHLKTRLNARKIDLNRNLPTQDWTNINDNPNHNPGPKALSEPENQFLHQLFEKYTPSIALSFHSWKPILNYNGDCKDVAEFLHNYNKYPIAPDIGYPTPGSMGTYLPEKYKAPVLTFECPLLDENVTLDSIWQENKEGLMALLQSDLLRR